MSTRHGCSKLVYIIPAYTNVFNFEILFSYYDYVTKLAAFNINVWIISYGR